MSCKFAPHHDLIDICSRHVGDSFKNHSQGGGGGIVVIRVGSGVQKKKAKEREEQLCKSCLKNGKLFQICLREVHEVITVLRKLYQKIILRKLHSRDSLTSFTTCRSHLNNSRFNWGVNFPTLKKVQ